MKKNSKRGFTLVELIVVLIIIVILAAILIPSLVKYIDKAHERSAIAECRQCVMAANTLLMEEYTGAAAAYTFDFDKCKELAEVTGTIESADADSRAELKHLVYTNAKFTVYYCKEGGCKSCGNSEEYTVIKNGADAGNAKSSRLNLEIGTLFKGAITLGKGEHIDSLYQDEPGRKANNLYNQLNDEQKKYLNNVNWCIYNDGTYGWRMYFTTQKYDNTTGKITVPVLKYDPTTNKYQYALNSTMTNGILDRNGTWHNSQWYDYNELPDEVKIQIK